MSRPRQVPSGAVFRQYTDVRTQKRPDGYVQAYVPEHPASNKRGWLLHHRLILETALGRYLAGTEEVHHLNGVRDDNRPENLELVPGRLEHQRIHSKKWNPEMIALVRRYAADPTKRVRDVPGISGATVAKMIRIHQIRWVDPTRHYFSEDQVREALQGRTTKQAADLLGCHHMTLRLRFPHLLTKRKSPTRRKPTERGASPGGSAP